MLDGMYKGAPVHSFAMGGCHVYVVRRGPALMAAWRARTATMVVFAPPRMSYRQAAAEAVAALQKGRFAPECAF